MTLIYLMNSLDKIYKEDKVSVDSLKDFSMLKNEKKSFQIVIEMDEEFVGQLKIKTDMENVSVYSVNDVYADFPLDFSISDDYYRLSEDNFYPELLLPVDSKAVVFKKGRQVFWVEISSSKANVYEVCIDVCRNGESVAENKLSVEVINAELDFGDFIYTNWFHTDCLMSHYKIEAFSDEYWRIVKNFLKVAVEHGMNCVLTPVFTPALDTQVGGERPTVQLVDVVKEGEKYSFSFEKLTKWIDMATDLGIQYFEISHFFTQWGAKAAPKIVATVDGEYKKIFGWDTASDSDEYVAFLESFSVALKDYFTEKGIREKIFLHISDEPHMEHLKLYSKASKLIRRLFEGYEIIDALSDLRFYEQGLVTHPIPKTNGIEPFLGKVENLWTYYCCVQISEYVSNRMFCFSSLRNRVLGYQLFKHDIKGFLHWGYNFYYTQYSIAQINPYEVTGAGKAFSAGDSFVVYPAEDGTAYMSLRLKVFYDGLQDMAALNTLAKLSSKEKALEIIDEDNSLTFKNYPHCEKWLLETREKVNQAIKELMK